MKKVSFCLVISISSLFFLTSGPYTVEGETLESGLSLCFTTDRAVYSSGDAIEMTLKVSNQAGQDVTLKFKDSQRFDFVIEKNGERLWRWSDGLMFMQVLGEQRLSPGQTITYTARFEGNLKPGTYKVSGMIVDRHTPLMASSVVFVK